ncbi:MAG: signal peptidase II [Gammaproteobacteria bacterium]|nr:signal peptidase II [Gammaproteobacteria bacterium]|tara:strand:+ start:1254 stop:1802 length:549 start_codon:yes stop_codon:yes gene_type:complete
MQDPFFLSKKENKLNIPNNDKSHNLRFTIWMILVSLIVCADQLSKWFIIKWIPLYEKISLNSFINITHHKNSGAAFSFLANAGGWQRWFLILIAGLVSIVIIAWLWRIRNKKKNVLSAGLILVVGGAIGNLIDRILFGHVTDFIQVIFGNWAFPTFNIADASISVGATLLIIDTLFFSGKEN